MKKKRSLLRLVLLVVFFCSISCNHAYYNAAKCRELEGKIYENKCYFVTESFKGTQCECQEYCNKNGNGTLVCVKSKEHNTWINENFPNHNRHTSRYIGLYKTEQTGPNRHPSKFSHTSMSCANSTMYLDGFAPGEPNKLEQQCVANYIDDGRVYHGDDGWNDKECFQKFGCICETDTIVNPKSMDETRSSCNSGFPPPPWTYYLFVYYIPIVFLCLCLFFTLVLCCGKKIPQYVFILNFQLWEYSKIGQFLKYRTLDAPIF